MVASQLNKITYYRLVLFLLFIHFFFSLEVLFVLPFFSILQIIILWLIFLLLHLLFFSSFFFSSYHSPPSISLSIYIYNLYPPQTTPPLHLSLPFFLCLFIVHSFRIQFLVKAWNQTSTGRRSVAPRRASTGVSGSHWPCANDSGPAGA